MQTAKITTYNYRTHLLNKAVKTGNHALANLAKTATTATIKNLFLAGYMMTKKQAAAAHKAYFAVVVDDRRN